MNDSTARTARGVLSTPVGTLVVTAADDGLRRISWGHAEPVRPAGADPTGGDPTGGDPIGTGPIGDPAGRWVRTVMDQLTAYFAGDRTAFELPVPLTGVGAATRAVLETLRATVPAGATVSYGELAARSGSGVPARAIGSIMGSNPVPIVIPCHRVVAADGLGGYSGGHRGQGRQTKLWLLEHEGALPPALI